MDESLSFQSLFGGARKFAHSAMEAHANADEEVFLLHAGVSVERLVKAVLSRKSPFLLMEMMKSSESTLLHLTGVRQTSKIRTVGAGQAIARLRLMGALPTNDPDLDELIELRNGVAHLTAASGADFDGLTVFCKVTNALLSHVHEGHEAYWRPWEDLVDITLNEHAAQVEREARRRIEQARYRIKKRFLDLPPAVFETYASARKLLYGPQTQPKNAPVSFLLPQECPACQRMAMVVTGPPVLIRQDGPGEAEPSFFICMVCELTLDKDEVGAIGIGPRIPLIDENGTRLLSQAEEVLWYMARSETEIVEDVPDDVDQ